MSNHSNEVDKEMQEHLKDFFGDLGKTNRFPEGKLTKQDEGELMFAVGVNQGKVILNFNTPVAWMGMLPEQARELGRLLIKRSKEV